MKADLETLVLDLMQNIAYLERRLDKLIRQVNKLEDKIE